MLYVMEGRWIVSSDVRDDMGYIESGMQASGYGLGEFPLFFTVQLLMN